jgi:hypothetical protein
MLISRHAAKRASGIWRASPDLRCNLWLRLITALVGLVLAEHGLFAIPGLGALGQAREAGR